LKKLTASLLLVLVAAAALLVACQQGSKTITLRYKYEPGLKLTYDQTAKRSYKVMENDSLVSESSMTIDARVIQVIKSVNDDGTAEVHETDQWFYDRPSEEDSTKMEKYTEERRMVIQVKPDGDIVDVEFLDEVSFSSRAYLKNYLEQAMPVFPKGELSPGFSWTQSAKVMMPDETMEASTTYHFKTLVREAGYDCAVIEYEGNLIIPILPEPGDSVQVSGVDNIKTTGKLFHAYKEGMVVLQRERWVVDGTRNVTKAGKTTHRSISMETDVDFSLSERTIEK